MYSILIWLYLVYVPYLYDKILVTASLVGVVDMGLGNKSRSRHRDADSLFVNSVSYPSSSPRIASFRISGSFRPSERPGP